MVCMIYGVAQCFLLLFVFYKDSYYIHEITKKIEGRRIVFQILIMMICTVVAFLAGMQVCKISEDCYEIGLFLIVLLGLSWIMIIDSFLYIIPNRYLFYMCLGWIGMTMTELMNGREKFLDQIIFSCRDCMILLGIFVSFNFITQGGIGFGDIKLIAVIGLFCGIQRTFYIVGFGFILSGVVSCILVICKKKSMKDILPLGPFLYGGYLLMLLFQDI